MPVEDVVAAEGKTQEEEAASFLNRDARTVGVTLESESEVVQPSGRRFGRKALLLAAPAALVLAGAAVWGAKNPTAIQQWTGASLQNKGYYRHHAGATPPESVPAQSIADCVFDSQFAVENMMALGLSITGASRSCPVVHEAARMANEPMPMAHPHDPLVEMRKLQAVNASHQARFASIVGKSEVAPNYRAITNNTLKHLDEVVAKYKLPKRHLSMMEHWHRQKELEKISVASERVCAADVSGILARMGYVAANLAPLVTQCQVFYDPEAYCASDVARLLAGVSMTASSASEIAASCTDYNKYVGSDLSDYEYARRLRGEAGEAGEAEAVPVRDMFRGLEKYTSKRKADEEARNFALTTCVTASWFSATFFARFLDMGPAVKHCKNDNAVHCSAAVIDLLSALAWTASSISYAVSECPVHGNNENALCAAGITKLVAALADASSALSVVAPTCGNLDATKPPDPPVLGEVTQDDLRKVHAKVASALHLNAIPGATGQGGP